MPISIVCPNGHKLSAKEEHAGKKLRCPKCRADILVPAEDDNDAEAEPKKRRKGKKRWRATTPGIEGVEAKLDLGLRLHKYRLVCHLFILLLVLLAMIFHENTPE